MNIHEQTQSELARQDRLAEQMHVCTYDGLLYHRSEMVMDPMQNYIAIRNLDNYIDAQELSEYEQYYLNQQIRKQND